MSLDRYDLEECDGDFSECKAKMVAHRHGDYVLFGDVETLIDEIRRNMQSSVDDIHV